MKERTQVILLYVAALLALVTFTMLYKLIFGF